jgi:NHLM bacteriocin system ABC transporter ATP-binding protein
MIPLTEDIHRNSEEINTGSNKPFFLNEYDDIFFIKEGAVDIFAIDYRNQEILQRLHIGRIYKDNILLGLKNIKLDDNIKLMGVSLPDTKLLKVKRDAFEHYLQQEDHIPTISQWVDHWLQQIVADLLKQFISPKNFAPLLTNQQLTLKENEFAMNLQSPLWIKDMKGQIEWLNTPISTETLADNFFPIPSENWIETKETTHLNTINTADCIRAGKLLSSLDIFHQQLIPCIQEMFKILITDEIKHLNEKYKNEHRELDLTLHHFSDLIKMDESETFTNETGNALFDACQHIARFTGIHLRVFATKHLKQTEILDELCKKNQLVTRQVNLTANNWWQQDNGALLGFLKENNRPIALIPTYGSGYDLVDTTENKKTKVTKEIADLLHPTAIMFFRAFPAKNISLKNLIFFGLKNSYHDITRLVVLGSLGGLFAIAIPYATGVLFNTIIPANELSQLWQVISILVIITIGIAIFQMANAIALLRIEGKVSVSTQAAMVERLFNLPAPFFRQFSSGDLAQRTFATDSIMQLITGSTQTALLGGIFSLFSWIYMFFINTHLAILATGLVLIAVGVFTFLNIKKLKFEREYSRLQGIVLNRIFQLLIGIAKLRIAGAEIKAFIHWAESFKNNVNAVINAQKVTNYLLVFDAVFLIISYLAIFGFIELWNLPIHTGDFLAFFAAFTQFSMAILAMSVALTSATNAIPLYERAQPILKTKPEVDPTKVDPGELRGKIEINHLCFRYNSDAPWIINDINLHVEQGEFVALVGPSSSGKSTLLRLLLGLENPESGAIYYDGKDLAELNVQAVRRQIGVVIQNAKLLPGDIFTNIVGSSQATLEDAWEAARLAGFDKDIEAMPMGMNTVIGEGTSTISGGQRQRLIIARAIVNKPKILLFDEASSALDNLTQATVSKSLQALNATRIIIAHRLSTIVNANRIYVLEDGKIIEEGTFEQLMKSNGKFAYLAKRQIVN